MKFVQFSHMWVFQMCKMFFRNPTVFISYLLTHKDCTGYRVAITPVRSVRLPAVRFCFFKETGLSSPFEHIEP